MREQTTIEKILSIGFLIAIFAMCVTLLFIAIDSRRQRDSIICILLVQPADRTQDTIKECRQ